MQPPPPENWQEFETLCCDLWRRIWNDPNTQKNGRQGQPQHGIDIYGRPNNAKLWAGVQCKGKDNYTDKSLTEAELRKEVENALKFEPRLSEFTIATTGPRDGKIQEVARKITEDHLTKELFSVYVWFWVDIRDRLGDFPDILDKLYPSLSINTEAIKTEISIIKGPMDHLIEDQTGIRDSIASLRDDIRSTHQYNISDITSSVTSEYHAELDYARELITENNPKKALDFLNNLKERIWSQAPSMVKFRILTNIGAAKLMMNITDEAAKLFLEALQYNPDDEKALCNAALAYLLIKQLGSAIAYSNIVLEKNPANSQAHSVIIQASEGNDLKSIIDKIPDSYRNSPEIACAIGHIAEKKKSFLEAKGWLETALEGNGKDMPEIKAALGGILLEMNLGEQPFIYDHTGIDEDKKEDVNKAIGLLTEAWESIQNKDLKDYRTGWIINRAIGRKILGQLKEAIDDIDVALKVEPSNPTLIKYKALFLNGLNDNETAIKLLKDILWNEETPEAAILLADILRIEGRYEEGTAILNELIKRNPSPKLEDDINHLLIQIYLESNEPKDIKQAKTISESMRNVNPTSILNLVDAAKILRRIGEKSESISLLLEASKYVSENTVFRELFSLSNEFYALEQFEDASKLYERISNKQIDSPLTRKLLKSYYFAGDRGKALAICDGLRAKYGPLRYVTEMESAIYEEIDDFPRAKRITEDFLKLFPDDFQMKLQLAYLNLKTANYADVDEFLIQPFNVSEMSLQSAHSLAYLNSKRSLHEKALNIMYEARRRFFNESDAHLKYIGFVLSRGKDIEQLMNFTSVIPDSAICIETDPPQQEWYILDNRADADMHRREINLEHSIAKKLVGKQTGEEVILRETPISKDVGKIKEIKSKYLYAFHESLAIFEKLFPEAPGLWGVKVEPAKEEGQLPEYLKLFFEQISKQQDWIQQLEQMYIQQKITIGVIAKLLAINVIDVIGGLINNPEVGIRCCQGNTIEREAADKLLNSKPRLIIDIISLLTFYEICGDTIFSQKLGTFGIAQSTINLIEGKLDELNGLGSEGFMTISKKGEQFFKHEVSRNDVRTNIEFLSRLLDWIGKKCMILPVRAALSISKKRRDQLNDIFGASFVDTLLIASEPGNLLYSDDFQLRMVAKNDFKVDGTWTQPLFMYHLKHGILGREEYNKYIVKLISANYYYISIDQHILVESAKQSNWLPTKQFSKVIKILNGNMSDESTALMVSINFLYELWKQPILPLYRDYLIISLVNELTIGRNKRKILIQLKYNLKEMFNLFPLIERSINQVIDIWEKAVGVL
jgi:predicted Zn-dependent protease/transcription elongation GreA/GreB family factor